MYVESEPKILASAEFFSGDEFDEIALDSDAAISVNGKVLQLKASSNDSAEYTDNRYIGEFDADPLKIFEFKFKQGDVESISKISIPAPIKMTQPLSNSKVSRWKDLIIKWDGEAPKEGETILATLYVRKPTELASQKDFDIILQQSISEKTSIFFASEKLQKLKSGQMEVSIQRSFQEKSPDKRLTAIYGAKNINVEFD